jgi:hypothetical protein
MTTLTVYTFDLNSFSDLHKDSCGYRSSSDYYEWLSSATDDEKQTEWDRLLAVMSRCEAERHECEIAAIARFEQC